MGVSVTGELAGSRERTGALVATCKVTMVPNLTRSAAPCALIENVITHADRRRQGHGRAVLDAALAAAWAAACYKAMLMAGSHQDSTLRSYEQAVFERGKTALQARRG